LHEHCRPSQSITYIKWQKPHHVAPLPSKATSTHTTPSNTIRQYQHSSHRPPHAFEDPCTLFRPSKRSRMPTIFAWLRRSTQAPSSTWKPPGTMPGPSDSSNIVPIDPRTPSRTHALCFGQARNHECLPYLLGLDAAHKPQRAFGSLRAPCRDQPIAPTSFPSAPAHLQGPMHFVLAKQEITNSYHICLP
jgi:hypothetical protein